jgi:hypothetical protein
MTSWLCHQSDMQKTHRILYYLRFGTILLEIALLFFPVSEELKNNIWCVINNNIFHITVMSELLFECYGVPSVCYGVDGLFSFRHNNPKCSAALIINCGYHTTHILPLINNQIDPTRSRRINVGGIHIINYLHRLLQLKYPAHFAAITPSRAEVCGSSIYLV